MNNIYFTKKVSLSVCPNHWTSYLYLNWELLELREIDLSAAVLNAEFTSIEKLEAVVTVMSVMPGPADKNEGQQSFKPL